MTRRALIVVLVAIVAATGLIIPAHAATPPPHTPHAVMAPGPSGWFFRYLCVTINNPLMYWVTQGSLYEFKRCFRR